MPSSMSGIHGVPMSETSIAVSAPELTFTLPVRSVALPLHAVGGITQRAPEVFHGKRIQLWRAEVTGQHGAAKRDDIVQGQKT